jgi:hypothetical protein
MSVPVAVRLLLNENYESGIPVIAMTSGQVVSPHRTAANYAHTARAFGSSRVLDNPLFCRESRGCSLRTARAATSSSRRSRVTGGWRVGAQEGDVVWAMLPDETRPILDGVVIRPAGGYGAWAAGHGAMATCRWCPRRPPLRVRALGRPLRACRASSA